MSPLMQWESPEGFKAVFQGSAQPGCRVEGRGGAGTWAGGSGGTRRGAEKGRRPSLRAEEGSAGKQGLGVPRTLKAVWGTF